MAYVLERHLPEGGISIARLHGQACIGCGHTATKDHPLKPAGEILVAGPDGQPMMWPVATCPDCTLRET